MNIGIAGYTGRMSQLLIKELATGTWDRLNLVAVSTRRTHPEYAIPEKSFAIVTSADDLAINSDCIIDFTTPESTMNNIDSALKHKTAMVIGTTGFDDLGVQKIKNASHDIPILFAANTSIGVTLLLSLIEQAAQKLGPDWDIEIHETHHHHKIDSPSGTAVAMGKSAQKGRGGGDFIMDRAGKRQRGDIGYAVSRGGDVVGEHTLTFFGAGERLELGHKATDRSLFARGALKAAQWLVGKPAGLYTMRDVLGI